MIEGLIPVMLTPFKADLSVNWEGMDSLVDFYIRAGSAHLFTCCLSSEMYELDSDERLALARRVAARAKSSGFTGQILASGTFGGPIPAQADFARRMHDAGADIVVILANQIVSADDSSEDFRRRLAAFNAMTDDIPLGLYECPAPYHRLIDLDTLDDCVKSRRYRYLKETSRDRGIIRKKIASARGTPLSVCNAYLLGIDDFYRDGGRGMSPVAANYIPQVFSEYHKAFLAGDDRAAELCGQFARLDTIIRYEYPHSAKWFLNSRGIGIQQYCRKKPKHELKPEALNEMARALLEIEDRLALPTL